MPLLDTSELTLVFGGLTAIGRLSFAMEAGEIVSLIGPNGAGKTSVFNCITGFYKRTSGDIRFQGRSLIGLQPYRITELGLARTFQNIRLFSQMTVLENVMVGRHTRTHAGIFQALLRTPGEHREESAIKAEARRWLEFVNLADQASQLARNLPYGAQRRLEIARALASEPKLLLLDEPGAGLNYGEKQFLMELIRKIRAQGITPLLIEHDMGLVMKVSDRIVVLDHGEKIAEGTPDQVRTNPKVIEAYLGEEP